MIFDEDEYKGSMFILGVILGLIFLGLAVGVPYAAWTSDMDGKRWSLFALLYFIAFISLGLSTECFKKAGKNL